MCETACLSWEGQICFSLATLHRLQIFDAQSWGGPLVARCSFLQLDLYTFVVPAFTGLLVLRTAWREIRRQGHADLT